MASNDEFASAMLAIMEDSITNDPKLAKEYCTGKKDKDFVIGDVVSCTYLKGLYRVAEVFKGRIEVYPIELIDKIVLETAKISPNFLRRADFNPDAVKILYSQ